MGVGTQSFVLLRDCLSHGFQITCLVFPDGCELYEGPHDDVSCYQALWNESGCISEGNQYPDQLSIVLNENYADQNLE